MQFKTFAEFFDHLLAKKTLELRKDKKLKTDENYTIEMLAQEAVVKLEYLQSFRNNLGTDRMNLTIGCLMRIASVLGFNTTYGWFPLENKLGYEIFN